MRIFVAALSIALVIGACSGDDGTAVPTVTPSGSAIPGIPSEARISSGTAAITVTGGATFERSLTADTESTLVNEPPAGFAMIFRQGNDNILSISGEAFDGERVTSRKLVLGLVLESDDGLISFSDTDGACTVRMTPGDDGVAGSFACPNVSTETGTFSFDGSFTVRR